MYHIKNKKILLLISAALIIVLSLFIMEQSQMINLFSSSQDSPHAQSGPTEDEKKLTNQADAEAKQNLIEKGGQSPSPPTTQPASSTNTALELSAQQEDNEKVTIFTKLINFYSGTCELTVTNGAKTHTQNARIYYQSEFSSCAGFSVPVNELGMGNWSIQLNVIANGNTMTKKIQFEVK